MGLSHGHGLGLGLGAVIIIFFPLPHYRSVFFPLSNYQQAFLERTRGAVLCPDPSGQTLGNKPNWAQNSHQQPKFAQKDLGTEQLWSWPKFARRNPALQMHPGPQPVRCLSALCYGVPEQRHGAPNTPTNLVAQGAEASDCHVQT